MLVVRGGLHEALNRRARGGKCNHTGATGAFTAVDVWRSVRLEPAMAFRVRGWDTVAVTVAVAVAVAVVVVVAVAVVAVVAVAVVGVAVAVAVVAVVAVAVAVVANVTAALTANAAIAAYAAVAVAVEAAVIGIVATESATSAGGVPNRSKHHGRSTWATSFGNVLGYL